MVTTAQAIPPFLREFIKLSSDDISNDITWATVYFSIDLQKINENKYSTMNVLQDIYIIAKKNLELRINDIDDTFCSFPISSEMDFLNYKISDILYYTTQLSKTFADLII